MESTGNAIVDFVGQMNISGNVIPQAWYKTITRENGKPNLPAIVILADVVYWYRPTEVRDESTGRTVAARKRFQSDLLQRSYAQISEQFGISKREAQAAVAELERLGIVKRHFRTIEMNGVKMSNVLFIELVPSGLYSATFADAKNEIAITFERDTLPHQNVTPPTPKRDTNTGITHKTTTENKKDNARDEIAATSEKPKKAKEPKHRHGEFGHVMLTDAEFDKIKADFPSEYLRMIRDLDEYLEEHPAKSYANHSLTMRRWKRRDDEKAGAKQTVTAKEPQPVPFGWEEAMA